MSSLQAGFIWPLSERLCHEETLYRDHQRASEEWGRHLHAHQHRHKGTARPLYATLAPELKGSEVLGKAAYGALQLKCRELLENGGFIHMPSVKVRARGKAAAGLSAGVKAGVMGGTLGKSPAHFGRCALQSRFDLSLGGVHWQDFFKKLSRSSSEYLLLAPNATSPFARN